MRFTRNFRGIADLQVFIELPRIEIWWLSLVAEPKNEVCVYSSPLLNTELKLPSLMIDGGAARGSGSYCYVHAL